MTKYRIRLKNGRVIGPFLIEQLHELKAKSHIVGSEEAQIFPTGDWLPLNSFEFYAELIKENKTTSITPDKSESTFVIDLNKLRNKKKEFEINQIDVVKHQPIVELTETIRIASPLSIEKDIPKTSSDNTLFEMQLDNNSGVDVENDNGNKTIINPVAQQEIERLKREQKVFEESKKAEEEQKKHELEIYKKQEAQKIIEEADETTQMIRLDSHRDLMLVAQEEEEKIEKEIKAIKKKKKAEEDKVEQDLEDEEEENEEVAKKKKIKLIGFLAIVGILYAILFPSDEKPKNPPFVHLNPIIVFPVPFDKADGKRAQIEYEKAVSLFASGEYPNLIKSGELLKSGYENNIDSEDILSLLVRVYAEELKHSKEKLLDAQIIFNLIQAKRPFLARNPNGAIGLNLFYMAINKAEAASDVLSKYLKLYPKNVTQDLFAVYLKTLMKTGKIDATKQFHQALLKAPQKNRYTYDALIEYSLLNQEHDQALEYMNEAIKNNPKLALFYLYKLDFVIKNKNFKEAEALLAKLEELNMENSDFNRARYLELKGLILAKQGDAKGATAIFMKSLQIEDSMELRMKLADLAGSDNPQNETDKLIAESKAIKQLSLAKEFFEKKSYELAMSAAAKATDVLPGHIPSELFLAKVQLRLGLAKQALKTLEELIKIYPDNNNVNLALIDAYIETYKFNDAKNRIAIVSGTELKNSYEFASANGRLYIKMGDSLQAISWLRNSINMNPLNDHDIYLLSELLIKRANFDAARLLLNKCMELDPVNTDYRIAYSKIVYEQQDDSSAIGYLLGLLNEFGENPRILSEIAVFYYRAGKIKDFQVYKEKLEKLPTKDKSLYEFLIRAALLDERFDEIPNLVEQLIAIEPGELEAMMTAGRVLYENGKLVEAAKWFKRIQEKLETYPKVQYYIAKIKYLSKDFDGAMKDVEADLKANGDNDADLTLMAEIFVEKGDLIQAENMYKKSQKINPKNFDALMGLADLSTKRNNFDLALDLYKKAMIEKGDQPIIHKKIGDVYRLLGQGALAVESYKLYLEMNPEAPDKSQIQSYINLMQ